MLTPISLGDNRFKDVNGVRVIGGSVPTGWVLKFGLVEVFHTEMSKSAGLSLTTVRALSSNDQIGAPGRSVKATKKPLGVEWEGAIEF